MILLGDDLVPFENLIFINSIDEIKKSSGNTTLIFEYDENLLKYCFENSLGYAVVVNSVKESIYANSLNSKYIICHKNLDKTVQKIAENYMFDSKILTIINNCNEIEEIALKEIDGIIYKKLLG